MSVYFNVAGAVCVCWRSWALHLFVGRNHWTWGHEEDWYDGPIDNWGFGPLFLLVRVPWGGD